MFISCWGIPVLVGFLEPDYAKFREMVYLAIDGMWQVFKLKRSTPRSDFCRIAEKNGILLRLINTLYSLNEATRLVSISAGTGVSLDGFSQRPHSDQLGFNHPAFIQRAQEPSRASTSNSKRLDAVQPLYSADADGSQFSNSALDPSGHSKLSSASTLDKPANVVGKEPSVCLDSELSYGAAARRFS